MPYAYYEIELTDKVGFHLFPPLKKAVTVFRDGLF